MLKERGRGCAQLFGDGDGVFPVAFRFVNFQQELECLFRIGCLAQIAENLFCTIEQARFQIVLTQFEAGAQFLFGIQSSALYQGLVHADGTFDFTAAAKQAAESEMQFHGFRIGAHDFDKGLDRLVLLFVEKKVQPPEIGSRQAAGLGLQMLDVNPCGQPAEAEEQGKGQQPPEFKFHRQVRSGVGLDSGVQRGGVRRFERELLDSRRSFWISRRCLKISPRVAAMPDTAPRQNTVTRISASGACH